MSPDRRNFRCINAWALLVALFVALVSMPVAASEREVIAYGAAPVHAAIPAAMASQLHIARVRITYPDAYEQLVDYVDGHVRGGLAPVWNVDAQGRHLDRDGLITEDPARFVLVRLEWTWFAITTRNDAGVATTQILVPDGTSRVPFAPDTTTILGEAYWYQSGQVHVIDIRHGTAFTSNGAATTFLREDLRDALTQQYRNDVNENDPTHPDFGLVRTATRMLDRTQLTGGHFGIIVMAQPREGFVFRGADVLINGAPFDDLYRWEGAARMEPNGLRRPDGLIGWTLTEASGDQAVWTAPPGRRRPDTELPEPARTPYLAMLGQSAPELVVVDRPEAATAATQELLTSVRTARAGDALDQQNAAQVGAAFAGDGADYLRSSNGVLTVDPAASGDPDLAVLREDLTAMPDLLAIHMQGEINSAEQLAPLAQEPPADSDRGALVDAIRAVDEELITQTPTSAVLTPRYRPRYAEMLPAGRTAAYHEGNPVPGDGDNSPQPIPDGAQDVGQPIYDLDGDGDLDRVYTEDPYGKGYDQIVFKWHVDDRLFQVKPLPQRSECNFALYVQNSARPEQTRKLFYVGFDDMVWREKQTRKGYKLGVNLYSYALTTHFEPTARPNEHRFALRYIGRTQPPEPPPPPPEPTTKTETWTTKATVTLPDATTAEIITESGSETLFMWPASLYDESELLTATFSDPAFVPRSIAGRPMAPCKFVRTVTRYAIIGAGSTPETPITQTVFFPADFRPENIAIEEPEAIPGADNAFMWDYRLAGDGLPFNYNRGANFGRHSRKAVLMNDPRVLARYGGDMPVQQLTTLINNGGTEFVVREVPDAPRLFPAIGGDTAGWIARRSNIHAAFDPETDLKPGGANINHHGERILDIVQGVGFYLYRGQKYNYSSIAEQRELLRKMWDYDLYQPRTVYALLHIDNDRQRPLLNTAVAPISSNARELYDVNNGLVRRDLDVAGMNLQTNAQRRSELKKTIWYFFSAARGREHEIAYALAVPKETKLYCVEWDNLADVERRFAGYDITFLSSDEEERKIKGEVITKIFGRTSTEARFGDGGVKGLFTQDGLQDLILAQPGRYVFTDHDMLYDKPACWVQDCALLDDEQFGDPRSDQWVVNHKLQFRHPMALYYDDRWSAVVAAYGANSDPRTWCAKWDAYQLPVVGDGADLCKIAFEGIATPERLAQLYDAMHPDAYAAAKEGDVLLPPRPEAVARPIAPTEPEPWRGGVIMPPEPVEVADRLRRWSTYQGPTTEKLYDLNPTEFPRNPLDGYTWEWAPWINGTNGPSTRLTLSPSKPNDIDIPAGGQFHLRYLKGTWSGGPAPRTNPDATTNPAHRLVAEWDGGSLILENTAAQGQVLAIPSGCRRIRLRINDSRPSSLASGSVEYYLRSPGETAAAFAGLTPAAQLARWEATVEKFDAGRDGWLRIKYPNDQFAGAPGAPEIWGSEGGDRLYPMGGNGRSRSAYLYGKVPQQFDPARLFICYDMVRCNRLSDGVLIASRYWNQSGRFALPAGEMRVQTANDNNDGGVYWHWTNRPGGNHISLADYAWPMTVAYYNAAINSDLVARVQWYQDIYQERRDAPEKIRRYQHYLNERQQYLDRKAQYDAWMATYPAALERYHRELATYQQALNAYDTYVSRLEQWREQQAQYLDAIERWKQYLRARDAWVYLVRLRIEESGVRWTEAEPTGTAYQFWRSQPEALACPECN